MANKSEDPSEKRKGLFSKKSSETLSDFSALINKDTSFSVLEAYKTLRTNLMFSMASSNNKCVAVTSSLPSEGKSTTIANLAITMSQTNAKVLLIDADMRKPTQHRVFNVKNKKGLSTILGGFCIIEEGIQQNIMPNLSIITVGQIPPNPSELLASNGMKNLLDILSVNFDYIFIDTPPVNIVTDALVLSSLICGFMLVTKQNNTTHDELQKAITSLEFADAKILGFVVTNALSKAGSYGKYKRYGKYKYAQEYKA